jgi:hypothetical protein
VRAAQGTRSALRGSPVQALTRRRWLITRRPSHPHDPARSTDLRRALPGQCASTAPLAALSSYTALGRKKPGKTAATRARTHQQIRCRPQNPARTRSDFRRPLDTTGRACNHAATLRLNLSFNDIHLRNGPGPAGLEGIVAQGSLRVASHDGPNRAGRAHGRERVRANRLRRR